MTGVSDGRTRGVVTALRRAAVLTPALLTLAVPHSDAAGSSRLAGTTVLTASTNATATVHVPRPATLVVGNTAESPDVDVSSPAGRFAGIALTAVDRTTAEPPTLVALQVGFCATPRCRSTSRAAREYVAASAGLRARRLTDSTQEITLAPGDYIARAITDGAPVRVTLRLSGLSGTAAVRLSRRFVAMLRTDSSASSVAAGIEPLRNVEVAHDFASDLGLMMDMIFVTYDPHVRSEWGYCIYQGDTKPPGGRYVPGCPNGAAGQWVDQGAPALHYDDVLYGADIALLPGRWKRGYYATGVGGASSLTAVSLWMDLV